MSDSPEQPAVTQSRYLLPSVNCGNMFQAPAGLRALSADGNYVVTPATFGTFLGFSINGAFTYIPEEVWAQPDAAVFVRSKLLHRDTVEDTYGMELSVLGNVRLLEDIPASYPEKGAEDVERIALSMANNGEQVDAMRFVLLYAARCLTYLVDDIVVLVIEYNPDLVDIPSLIFTRAFSESDEARLAAYKANLKDRSYNTDSQQLAFTVSTVLSDIETTQVHNVLSLHGVASTSYIKYKDVTGKITRFLTFTAECASSLGTYSFHESSGADAFLAMATNADDAISAFRAAGVAVDTYNVQQAFNLDAVDLQLGFLTRGEGDKYYMDCICHTDPNREVDLSELVHGVTDAGLPKTPAVLAVTFIVDGSTKVVRLPVLVCMV